MDKSASAQSGEVESNAKVTEGLNETNDSSKKQKYDSWSTALDVAAGVDLKGKTALVTGTNAGIGIETARTLCLCGAHVVMANRNMAESEKCRDALKKEKPDAEIDLLHVDLSSLQSVEAAAKEFLSKNWRLHILILNAGVFAPSEKSTIDGYETTFGVNHLGHFYLTYLLLPRIRESAPARIVIVSSVSHSLTGINVSSSVEDKLQHLMPAPNSYINVFRLYAFSKLCNVLMAMKLHRMEHQNGINVYVLHPGHFIGTSISRSFGILASLMKVLLKPFTKTLQQGAATTIYCAISDDVKNESGMYYDNCYIAETKLSAELARDEALQDALWNKSVQIVEEYEKNRAQQS